MKSLTNIFTVFCKIMKKRYWFRKLRARLFALVSLNGNAFSNDIYESRESGNQRIRKRKRRKNLSDRTFSYDNEKTENFSSRTKTSPSDDVMKRTKKGN